jgi:hypothetical protein
MKMQDSVCIPVQAKQPGSGHHRNVQLHSAVLAQNCAEQWGLLLAALWPRITPNLSWHAAEGCVTMR